MTAVVPHPRVELERLYTEHGERVRAICDSILRNRHEAEDAAQQVFVAALRALRGGTVPRDAGAWLATIARHESWVRARRSPATALPEGLEDRAQEDPATTVLRRAELAETWETIAGLPASQREALLLREVRGLGYDELADDLRVSRASVRSLLNRARTTLRMQLERGAAVVTGAQWVNVLARLFDSASTSPALPSAARAAAVGLGALAIAGGAVVGSAPTSHPRVRPAVHRSAASAIPHAAAVVSTDDRRGAFFSRRRRDSSVRGEGGGQRGEREALRSGEDGGTGSQTSGRDSSGGGGTDGGHDSSASGGSVATVVTSGSLTETTSSTSGSDGGGSSSGGSSDGGSVGSSGSSDGGSSDGGS